jgi:hypothetical protein
MKMKPTKAPQNQHIKMFEVFADTQKKSDILANEIGSAIVKIDDSMSYVDFALAVGKTLRDEYGSHNIEPFMDVLRKDLGL